MNLEERIETFSVLGKILREALGNNTGRYSGKTESLIKSQQYINPWFTPDNVFLALNEIASQLTLENLVNWTASYPFLKEKREPVRVGLIFAGNIPLAGFHDFLTVLMSGNSLIAKTSSKDPDLIPFLADIICSENPGFRSAIQFTSGTLSGFDAVIATGSNNSSRYFEYYFGKYPNIIRKNRNSIAVIDGTENTEEKKALGKDIFSYFGLGCRNVSKIYLPAGYSISELTEHWKEYSGVINHQKYANNYDYNKAVYLVNKHRVHDTGFLLMKEEARLSSPVSVLHYEYYTSGEVLQERIGQLKDAIQCVVGKNKVPFGMSQSPHLWEYADGIDTMEFLLKKNLAGIL
jgi:hypothetical protein